MRKDVESEIAAAADGKCRISSYFIEGITYNRNN